jgi:hypothetical protein
MLVALDGPRDGGRCQMTWWCHNVNDKVMYNELSIFRLHACIQHCLKMSSILVVDHKQSTMKLRVSTR